jgi:cell pole-organizing protein PopZ
MAARDQVMSSTERAPEPTMEEILASIRRIISDDEQSSARQEAAPRSQSDEEDLESGEGEADNEIINDIARVLSGSGSDSEAESAASAVAEEEEEEILDLTAELGGLELVEEGEEIEEIELVEVAEEAPADIFNPAPARMRPVPSEASPEPEMESDLEPELELVEEAPAEEPVAEDSEPEPAPTQPAPAAPRQMSASEEAASALERAIAALRAGQVPTSSSPFSSQPRPEPVFTPPPEPVFHTQPEPAGTQTAPSFGLAPSFEPVPVPEPGLAPEPVPEPEAEPEFVLTEVEVVEVAEAEPLLVVETVASEPKADRPWAVSSAPDWSTQREGEREEGSEMPHVNGGGGYHAGAQKSLEDSVKDMLRPMLKQWLDENMSRVLTAALKDELRDNPARLRGE